MISNENQGTRIEVPPTGYEEQRVLEREREIERRPAERGYKAAAGGSAAESLAGIAAVILAILGLANIQQFWTTGVAVIALGAALLLHAMAHAARTAAVMSQTQTAGYVGGEVHGGMGVEFIGGVGAIVLGILALIGIASWTLMPIAVLAVGGSLLVGSAAGGRTISSTPEPFRAGAFSHAVVHEAATAASSMQMLAGLAGVVLGVLALIGISPVTLTLVGLLVLGAAVMFSGTAISSRMMGASRHY